MKKILVSLVAFLSLTACPQPQDPLNDIQPTPTPSPTPFAWSANLTCAGQITRAQWLTCDNPQLTDLHRRLAYQWQTGSQGASPQRLAVIEQQQRALVAERDACEDAVCVRNAYLRYLPPQPAATPKPPVAKPPKKWVKPVKRPVKWRPRPPRGDGEWRDVDAGRSCSADIGLPGAQELARQCDRVTAGQGWSCRVDRSCASLRRNIAKGCNETYRKPGFCSAR